MDDLKTILNRIKKPLSFAARDDFAHIKSLSAMEVFIHAQVENLKRIVKDRHEIAEIEALFAGFDALSLDKKKSGSSRQSSLFYGRTLLTLVLL